jgi:uncharacterized protein (DUF983 family)
MLLRGATWCCPWCGNGRAFFTGWFAKGPTCARCGLRWRRGDVGFELGAATVAAIVTLGGLVVALGVSLAVTWPEVAVVPLLIVLGIAALVVPVAIYPMTYTVWQALDLVMRPVAPDDFSNAPVQPVSDARG